MRPSYILPLLRELSGTFQAFEIYSAAHIRTLSLTPAQFDIVATLGNTQGMSPKELGGKTLITKGTLTGVIDRLVDKKLVCRSASPEDGRCQVIQLTNQGKKLFERVFPVHLTHVQRAFDKFTSKELIEFTANLHRLREAFAAAHGPTK
jgi:MarR family transcriptional regulator, 2-MHQ and catechol-resistance regulon repressor